MDFYDIEVETVAGLKTTLEEHRGDVLLIVNIASKCGYTPQLLGLENLWKKYQDRNFKVLGFPCNQFLRQAPGTNTEIMNFCQSNYGVSFPIYGKLNVKGRNISDLYKYLVNESKQMRGKAVKWNFEKFLLNRNGVVIKRFKSKVEPNEIEDDIELLL